jgi:hypothetical protein
LLLVQMMQFLEYLGDAAGSPLAYVAYVCVIAAWLARAWIVNAPTQRARQILAEFDDDRERATALIDLLGSRPPPGLKRSDIMEWVRVKSAEKARGYIVLAYLATLTAVVVIVGLASFTYLTNKRPPSHPVPTKLINENVIRD